MWHPHYVDWLALRLYDENQDGDVADTTEGEGEFYYLQDANYNVTAVAKSNGDVIERYHYSAYGKPTILNGAADVDPSVSEWTEDSDQTQSDIGNAYFYTGRELDLETGLQINRSRYYAAHLGRWINRDPIEYVGGMNMYAYVRGNPTRFVDPFGLDECGFQVWLYTGSWCVEDNVWDAAREAAGESYDENNDAAHDALNAVATIPGPGALAAGVGAGLSLIEGPELNGPRPAPPNNVPPPLPGRIEQLVNNAQNPAPPNNDAQKVMQCIGMGTPIIAMALGASAGSGPEWSNRPDQPGDLNFPSRETALMAALNDIGAVNDPSLLRVVPQFGKNPVLRGPQGQPWATIESLSPQGDWLPPIQEHPWGHFFQDNGSFELPHFHVPGRDGHYFYPFPDDFAFPPRK